MKLDWNKLGVRERDAVVATHIMKWTLDKVYCETGHWRTDSMGLLQATYSDDGAGEFSPSTAIQDAWLVVERMKRRGFQLQLFGPITNGQWVAKFVNHRPSSTFAANVFMGDAPTAPEAICLAACRAMGVEV